MKNNCQVSHRTPDPGEIQTFITTKLIKTHNSLLNDAIINSHSDNVIQSLSLHSEGQVPSLSMVSSLNRQFLSHDTVQ